MNVYDHTECQGKRPDQRAFSLMMVMMAIWILFFTAGFIAGALFGEKVIHLIQK